MIVIGVFSAGVGGTVEFLITEGESGWSPLIAALIGAIVGPLLFLLVSWIGKFRTKAVGFVNRTILFVIPLFGFVTRRQGKSKQLSDLKKRLGRLSYEFQAFRREVGKRRIIECGTSRESLGLSVAVQIMDHGDERLADKIRSYFWIGPFPTDDFPWTKTDNVHYVPMLRNRSDKRIVIYSDKPSAEEIKTAFNESGLLDEPVDRIGQDFAERYQRKYDIAIVIFPRSRER